DALGAADFRVQRELVCKQEADLRAERQCCGEQQQRQQDQRTGQSFAGAVLHALLVALHRHPSAAVTNGRRRRSCRPASDAAKEAQSPQWCAPVSSSSTICCACAAMNARLCVAMTIAMPPLLSSCSSEPISSHA